MRRLVKAVNALGDETRLRVLGVITERECCVCEVMQALDISQTRASRSLALLYDAGFLQRRKEGLFVLYSVAEGDVPTYLLELVKAVRTALEDNAVALQDKERLKKAERVGPGCVRQANKPECVKASQYPSLTRDIAS